MPAKKALKPICSKNAAAYIGGLSRSVAAYERRYEMSTGQMQELISVGKFPETAEVSKWLIDANVLTFLKARRERSMDGSPSSATRRSRSI